MPDLGLNKADKLLLVGSFCGAVLLGIALWNADFIVSQFINTESSGNTIGKVVSTKNEVRRRMSQSLSWYQAQKNEKIFERDSIFTGPDSEVAIELNNDQNIKLSADSLVVLQTKNNEVFFDLRLGSITTQGTAKKTVKIIQGSRVTEIKTRSKGNPVRISRDKVGKLTIVSKTDNVDVNINGQNIKLEKNETLKIEKNPDTQKEIFKKVVEPEPVAEIPELRWHGPERPPSQFKADTPPIVKEATQKVTLQFKPDVNIKDPVSVANGLINPPHLEWEPVPDAIEYSLDIDQNKNFTSPTSFAHLENPSFVWHGAKPGAYYWRVQAHNSEDKISIPSEPAKLLVRLHPPQLSPLHIKNEVVDDISLLIQKKTIQPKWKNVPMAAAYKVIADGQTSITKTTDFKMEIAPDIDSEFKVAAVDSSDHQISDFSVQKFKFTRKLELKTPTPLAPSDKSIIVFFNKNKIDPLIFAWRSVPKVKQYELQFASDKAFTKILSKEDVHSNKFVLKKNLSNGFVYWRVRSRFEKYTSNWSPPLRFAQQVSD